MYPLHKQAMPTAGFTTWNCQLLLKSPLLLKESAPAPRKVTLMKTLLHSSENYDFPTGKCHMQMREATLFLGKSPLAAQGDVPGQKSQASLKEKLLQANTQESTGGEMKAAFLKTDQRKPWSGAARKAEVQGKTELLTEGHYRTQRGSKEPGLSQPELES